MTRFPVSSSNEQCICAALEPSKNSWLLALQVPGRDNPSLYPIRGGNAEGLMAKLDAARDRVPQVTGSDAEGDAVHRGRLRRLLVGAVPRLTGLSIVWSWSRPACRSSAGRAGYRPTASRRCFWSGSLPPASASISFFRSRSDWDCRAGPNGSCCSMSSPRRSRCSTTYARSSKTIFGASTEFSAINRPGS